MKIYCAWCGIFMGIKDGEGIEGESHSVCERSYKKLTLSARIEQELKTNKKARHANLKSVNNNPPS